MARAHKSQPKRKVASKRKGFRLLKDGSAQVWLTLTKKEWIFAKQEATKEREFRGRHFGPVEYLHDVLNMALTSAMPDSSALLASAPVVGERNLSLDDDLPI